MLQVLLKFCKPKAMASFVDSKRFFSCLPQYSILVSPPSLNPKYGRFRHLSLVKILVGSTTPLVSAKPSQQILNSLSLTNVFHCPALIPGHFNQQYYHDDDLGLDL